MLFLLFVSPLGEVIAIFIDLLTLHMYLYDA